MDIPSVHLQEKIETKCLSRIAIYDRAKVEKKRTFFWNYPVPFCVRRTEKPLYSPEHFCQICCLILQVHHFYLVYLFFLAYAECIKSRAAHHESVW
jgi:hypothetical protein